MRQRLIISAVALFFLMLVLTALWTGFDWPPPRLILKYGFPPTGGPTGRTMTIEGVAFVELKPGYFRMGSHFHCRQGDLLGRICAIVHLPWGKKPKHESRECPPHWVEIERSFWIARTEITNEQFKVFAVKRPPVTESPLLRGPVLGVSVPDAYAYCSWLSATCGLEVRLPRHSEWEYACRAGTSTRYCCGDNPLELCLFAVHLPASGIPPWGIGEVASLHPNKWGLYDMHGSASEWCTSDSPQVSLACGGNFLADSLACGSACSKLLDPRQNWTTVGFRPVVIKRKDFRDGR